MIPPAPGAPPPSPGRAPRQRAGAGPGRPPAGPPSPGLPAPAPTPAGPTPRTSSVAAAYRAAPAPSAWPMQPPTSPPLAGRHPPPPHPVPADPTPGAAAHPARPAPRPGPGEAGGRLIGLDVARAVAIAGMLIAHYTTLDGTGGPWRYLHRVVDGKAMPLFLLLGGMGLTLLTRRARHPVRAVLGRAAGPPRARPGDGGLDPAHRHRAALLRRLLRHRPGRPPPRRRRPAGRWPWAWSSSVR